jgi:hypothetical protein
MSFYRIIFLSQDNEECKEVRANSGFGASDAGRVRQHRDKFQFGEHDDHSRQCAMDTFVFSKYPGNFPDVLTVPFSYA